jgi:TonB family protein
MNSERDQSFLFGSEINPPVPWRTYATSAAIHVAAVVLLLVLVPMVVTRDVKAPLRLATTLLAPAPLKPFKPEPPKVRPPKLLAKSEIVPKPLVGPPKAEPKPVVPPPVSREIPKPVPQPQIAAAEPKPIPRLKIPEVAPAPAIKPQVHTGIFGSEQAAKKVEVAKDLKVGGFGDPNGAKTSPETQKSTLIAKTGSFESPQGEGTVGGRGGAGRGTVRQTSFGAMEGAGSGPGGNGVGIGHGTVRQSGFGAADGGGGNGPGGNGRGGTVKTGGFGETAAAANQPAQRPKAVTPNTTPVEIISKPKPVYTPEARNLHLEGEVALDVIFSASGSVQILRVVQGLGHGLDEAAQNAAARIRFKPGTRDGAPVDTRATIRIVFELT